MMEARRGKVAVRSGSPRVDGGPDFRRGWDFTLDPEKHGDPPMSVHVDAWFAGRIYPHQRLSVTGTFNDDGALVASEIEDLRTRAERRDRGRGYSGYCPDISWIRYGENGGGRSGDNREGLEEVEGCAVTKLCARVVTALVPRVSERHLNLPLAIDA